MARWVPNEGQIAELLTGPSGPVYKHVAAFGKAVERGAKIKAPKDTGKLADGIDATLPIQRGGSLILRVSTGPVSEGGFHYALSVHQGRKGFGPRTAKALKFYWKQQQRDVVTQYVRSVPGRPFLLDAAKEANAKLPPGTQFKIIDKHPFPLITTRV